jgi:fucose permease
MAALFLVTRRRWDDPVREEVTTGDSPAAVGLRRALGEPLVRLQIVLFFLYVGIEFTVGQWCYTLLTESRGVGIESAGLATSAYYGAIGVGRVVAGLFAHRIGLDRLIRLAMLTVVAGIGLLTFGGPVSFGGIRLDMAGLLVVGLGLAPVFPCLMTRTPQRLGTAVAAHAVGFQVSAGMIGTAIVPGLAGILAERAGLESVTWFALTLAASLALTHEWVLRYSARRSK